MVMFSIIRILLLIPLSYYGFSGRRMQFAQFHHVFHGIAAFILMMHALGILEAETVLLQQHVKVRAEQFQTIGVMICLSFLSIGSHWTILRHVRTTAPRNSMTPGSEEMERKRKKQRLEYD